MIKLSVRFMAQYLLAEERARLDLLHRQKFPAPEMLARSRFYNEARTTIAALHNGTSTREDIETRISSLRAEAQRSDRWARSELVSNADVLERYLYYQAHRSLRLAARPTADLVRGDVRITARPTLFATEEGQPRLIFLEFSETADKNRMRLVAQLAYEAFRLILRNLRPPAIQVIDVRGGQMVELDRPGTSIGRDVALACKAITTAWPHLPPPKGWMRTRGSAERQLPIEWK